MLMNIKEFKSFNKKALFLATISVATLASCSKDEISQDISNMNQETAAMHGKSTGEYIIIMKDGNELKSRKQGLPYLSQIKMIEDLGEKMLSENGINIDLNDNNTFA